MYLHRILFLMAAVIPLFLLTTGISLITPAMASSKGGGKGGGPVTQEQVSTGNSQLDKEINKFYSCISKTHQDPPTIEKVDSCYYQNAGGSGTGSASPASNSVVAGIGSSPPTSTSSTSHHHKK